MLKALVVLFKVVRGFINTYKEDRVKALVLYILFPLLFLIYIDVLDMPTLGSLYYSLKEVGISYYKEYASILCVAGLVVLNWNRVNNIFEDDDVYGLDEGVEEDKIKKYAKIIAIILACYFAYILFLFLLSIAFE